MDTSSLTLVQGPLDPLSSPALSLQSAHEPVSLKEAALSYARQNLAIFPNHSLTDEGQCTCGVVTCHSPGKHPRTPHGLLDATTDLEQITRWWDQWPTANIGLATGKINGLVVVDVDTGGEKQGAKTLGGLCAEHGEDWLSTGQVRTGGGGTHLFFKYPEGIEKIPSGNGRFGKDIDCKADGGYVVAPPSLHASGNSYTRLNDREPQALPDWLLNMALAGAAGKTPRGETPRGENPAWGKERRGRAPGFTPLTVKRLAAALPYIKADGYDIWLKVGAAMHLAGMPVEDWIKWSERCPEKFEEGVCEVKWETFSRTEGEVASLGSVFFLAKEAGWPADGRWSEEEMDATVATLTEALNEMEGMEDSGPRKAHQRSEAARLLTTHCMALGALKEWRVLDYERIKSRLASLSRLGSRKFDTAVKQAIETQALNQATTLESQGVSRKSQWLRNFALTVMDNRYIDLRDGGAYSPEVFTKVAEREFPGGWGDVPAQLRFSREQNEFVRHDCYYPGEGRIVVKESTIGVIEKLVNTYNAPQDLPDPVYDASSEVFFLDHLMYVCGGEEQFVQYLLDWMAYIIQKPGQRIHSVPLIIGPKGNGKTFIADLMTSLLGKSNVGIISNDDLAGSFQDGLAGKQLLVLEEFKVFEGQNSMMERFKPWVTNERVGVNRKGLKKIAMDNVANTIAFSNHDDAIRIDADERRYAVAISRFPVKDEAFYTELFQTFIPKAGGSTASLRYMLLNRDLSAFNPYAPALRTDSRDEMIENNRSALERTLAQRLALGADGLSNELITFDELACVVQMAGMLSVGGRLSNHSVSKAAKAVGINQLANPKRLTAGGKATRVYSTRNHEYWLNASEREVRIQFEKQEAARKADQSEFAKANRPHGIF